MSEENIVLAGDFSGYTLYGAEFGVRELYLQRGNSRKVDLNKKTVERYEVIDEETTKSASSAVMRAGAGALVLGPIGLAAGLSAKKTGLYTISVEFKDGKRSLISFTQKKYKRFIEIMY